MGIAGQTLLVKKRVKVGVAEVVASPGGPIWMTKDVTGRGRAQKTGQMVVPRSRGEATGGGGCQDEVGLGGLATLGGLQKPQKDSTSADGEAIVGTV